MDDLVEQFRSVTNASRETAVHLLEACGGNLEMAIDCFLQQGEIQGGNGDGPSSSGAAAAAASFTDLTTEDLVRAPIAAKADVLVEESFQRSYAPTRRARQANSVFSRFRDFEAETKEKEESLFGTKSNQSNQNSGAENKKKTLENLFRPPLEIMHRGTFETAKAAAESKGFWLMVNVQKTEEFACQALNRDVWKNPAVQDLILNNFVLWQIYIDSADGQRFQTYYRVPTFPFVCILDPRTGELLASLKTNDSQVFCETVSNFLESNASFNSRDSNLSTKPIVMDQEPMSSATATVPKNKFQSSSSGGLRGGGKRRLENGGTNGMHHEANGNHAMEQCEEPKSKVVKMDDEDSSSGVSTSSSAASYAPKPTQPEETKQHPIEGSLNQFGTPDIRLMFRLPDGSKRYLGALKRTTIQEVLSYAEREWQLSISSHDFVMNFPTRRLNKEDPKRTLESLSVQRQDLVYVEEK